jgi:hypothetical protein
MGDLLRLGCMSCGAVPAKWLVTRPYDTLDGPGRLMHYCDEHHQEHAKEFGVALPLWVVDTDPDAFLTLLYESGATQSNPSMVAKHLGLDGGTWLTTAQRIFDGPSKPSTITRQELIDAGTFDATWEQDRINSISREVGQAIIEGHRAVVVGTGAAKVQIGALLDVLDLHFADPISDRVIVCLGSPSPEALGAIRTLADALVAGPEVDVLVYTDGSWSDASNPCWEIADSSAYAGWADLLAHVSMPPPLVEDLVRGVGLPELRSYPMLKGAGAWSVRLEGLEVGQVGASRGTLGVGKVSAQGNTSHQRKAWEAATGLPEPFELTASTIDEAVSVIKTFAEAWLVPTDKPHQTEHALESRILRGAVPIRADGRALSLIREDDGVVNWGSQFPIKWGPGGSARYLDALLRDGDVPWAIEMKVEGPAGVGSYYRHAVAQAVLYREFIRRAEPLHFWFDDLGLDATQCRAAVVVPGIKQSKWRSRLAQLCDAFGISLVEVDPAAAESR